MRIDLNTSIGHATDPAKSTTAGSSPGVAKTGCSPDVAELSPDYLRVPSLATAASRFPEIRQEKVAALSTAIRSGSYNVSSAQTAESLLAHITANPA